MTKQEFMNFLKYELEKNQIKNINEIIADYEEHFAHALAQNKSEEEICKNLGSPESIAKAYQTESLITELKNPETPFSFKSGLSVLGRLILLAPFNFFLFFIPGSFLLACITAGWVMGFVLAALSLAAFTTGFNADLIQLSAWYGIGAFSASMTLLGSTILCGLVMFVITKSVLLMVISYLQWNLKFILEK